MTICKRLQILWMKRKARWYIRKAAYCCGDGGAHITATVHPDVDRVRREYDECIEWLRQYDPEFPCKGGAPR